MSKKSGPKNRIKHMLTSSPAAKKVKETAKNVGESLGLYPENEAPPSTAPSKLCGVGDCSIAGIHRHPDKPVAERQSEIAPSRQAYFETGSAEHLPEGVVSLNEYRKKKKSRKPEGY